jgi:hypothetical protein
VLWVITLWDVIFLCTICFLIFIFLAIFKRSPRFEVLAPLRSVCSGSTGEGNRFRMFH